jgi:hypothetical protein
MVVAIVKIVLNASNIPRVVTPDLCDAGKETILFGSGSCDNTLRVCLYRSDVDAVSTEIASTIRSPPVMPAKRSTPAAMLAGGPNPCTSVMM